MQSQRSIGIVILVCSIFCLMIAADKYYQAIAKANFVAKELPGFELESVAIPTETIVCGPIGVMLLVASVILIAKSFRPSPAEA